MAKVLHVVESLQAGGAERVVVEYAKWHDRSRYEPEVCCVLSAGPFADSLEASGVAVHVLGRKSRFDLGAILRLARIIRRGRFDVVIDAGDLNDTIGVLGLRQQLNQRETLIAAVVAEATEGQIAIPPDTLQSINENYAGLTIENIEGAVVVTLKPLEDEDEEAPFAEATE